jgi:hypothetical protein
VTTPRQSVTVSRTYTPDADACLQAVSYLLKNSARKKGTRPGAPDARKESDESGEIIVHDRT